MQAGIEPFGGKLGDCCSLRHGGREDITEENAEKSSYQTFVKLLHEEGKNLSRNLKIRSLFFCKKTVPFQKTGGFYEI